MADSTPQLWCLHPPSRAGACPQQGQGISNKLGAVQSADRAAAARKADGWLAWQLVQLPGEGQVPCEGHGDGDGRQAQLVQGHLLGSTAEGGEVGRVWVLVRMVSSQAAAPGD